jgi:LytS/YehU family sensor histidine kinase
MKHEAFLWSFILNCLFLIAYFYFNLNVLVPCFLSKKKTVIYIAITLIFYCILCFAVPWIIRSLLQPSFPASGMPFPERHGLFPPPGDFPRHNVDPHRIMLRLGLYAPSTRFFIVFIVSTGLKVITQWYDEKRRLKELENSKTAAELSFLKSQIHPHFLFNSLNSIYYLALSKDDNAPKAILSLSNFLRFVTIESDKSFIPLEKELNMLSEYLNLQSLRASEKFDLQFTIQGDFNSLHIMPLTFIPFVENAFKYGISAHIECFIHLYIKIENKTLEFTISNSINQGEKNIIRSSGIGLENIRKRLELAYPEHYRLDMSNDSRIFSVYLKINLE